MITLPDKGILNLQPCNVLWLHNLLDRQMAHQCWRLQMNESNLHPPDRVQTNPSIAGRQGLPTADSLGETCTVIINDISWLGLIYQS